MYSEYDEDEMMQVASEMSLYDVMENFSNKWSQHDYMEAHNTLILLGQTLGLAEAEVLKSKEQGPPEEVVQFTFEAPKPVLPSMIRENDFVPTPESVPRTPIVVYRKSTSCDKIADLSSRVLQELSSLSSKLTYLHRKLSHAVEYCPIEDPSISRLIDLNDDIVAMLSRAKEFMPYSAECVSMEVLSNAHISRDGGYYEDLLYLQHERLCGENEHLEEEISNPQIADIMYILSRNSCKEDMSQAISKLLHMFCSSNNEEKLRCFKEMQKVGVLATLLISLPRCQQWSDVSMQVSKAIAVLVAFEENWYLLKRSAYDILSALRILQIKSNLRAGIPSYVHKADPLGAFQPLPVVLIDESDIDVAETSKTHALEQLRDVRGLVAAALAKLTTVLCNDWSKETLAVSIDCNYFDNRACGIKSRVEDKTPSSINASPAISDLTSIVALILETIVAVHCGADEVAALHSPRHDHHNHNEGKKCKCKHSHDSDDSGPNVVEVSDDDKQRASTNHCPCVEYVFKSMSRVDKASVVTSISLCSLCEIIHCRPCLASAGVIEVLKRWIDIGSDLLKEIRSYVTVEMEKYQQESANMKELSPSLNDLDSTSHDDSFNHFRETIDIAWIQANELINNAAAVIMYLLGGNTDYRVVLPGPRDLNESPTKSSFTSNPSALTNSSEVVVRWVDSQVLNDGLAASMVKYITTALSCTDELTKAMKDINSCEIFSLHASAQRVLQVENRLNALFKMSSAIFPRVTMIHLAQSLFLIGSRPNNRASFLADNCPLAMASLLVQAVQDYCDEVEDSDTVPIIDYSGVNELSKIELDRNDQNGIESWKQRRTQRSQQQQRIVQEIVTASAVLCACGTDKTNDGIHFLKELDSPHIDAQLLMVSISSTCLESFHSLLLFNADHSSQSSLPNHQLAALKGVLKILCQSSVVESILYVLSRLPRGHCRLAALRVVAALSDWPDSREALFKGNVVDALVLISSEADELHRIKLENREKELYGFNPEMSRLDKRSETSSKLLATKSSETMDQSNHSTTSQNSSSKLAPLTAPRDLVGAVVSSIATSASSVSASTLFGLSQSFSIQNPNNIKSSGCSNMMFDRIDDLEIASLSSSRDLVMDDSRHSLNGISRLDGFYDQDDEETKAAKLAEEETMIVCYALANFCRGSRDYAERVFDNGLLSIMLQLVKSNNMEISRQSLRCICSMCQIISMSPTDKVGASRQSKTALYHDVMLALNAALASDISVMQKEAVVGIANLACDESLHYEIIDSCFKKVVSFLLDHHADVETKNAAEKVLHSVGFTGGIHDFELCHYDVELMCDWFYLRRSFVPQTMSSQLLSDWVRVLFQSDPKSADAIATQERRLSFQLNNPDDFMANIRDSQRRPSAPAAPEGVSSAQNSGLSLTSAGMALKNISLPQVHKSLTNRLIKMLPFCLGRQSSLDILAEEELEAVEQSLMDAPQSAMSPVMSVVLPSVIPQRLKSRLMSFNKSSSAYLDYYGLVKAAASRREEFYPGQDSIPVASREILDIFYPSKLLQVLVIDGLSYRSDVVVSKPSRSIDLNCMDVRSEDILLLPQSLQFMGFYFPPCSYSFDRIRRVLESKIEALSGQRKFALALRDDSFATAGIRDFVERLQQFLVRRPEVASLSISCHGVPGGALTMQSPPEDSVFFGHLVGNIPQSIRYLTLRGVLSSESLQATCILLKKNNFAFQSTQLSDDASLRGSHQYYSELWKQRAKGLLALAITQVAFTPIDVTYILELLTMYLCPYSVKTSPQSNSRRSVSVEQSPTTSDNSKDSHSSSSISLGSGVGHISFTTHNTVFEDKDPRGLRFLDVSGTRLSDSTCADVLYASTCGPLEGLELADNQIHKGAQFLDTFCKVVAAAPLSYLRYLGLSNNMLTAKFICSLLDALHGNITLTSLDVSNNEFQHSIQTKESLRGCIKKNKGLRVLNLSHNKLTAETTKTIFLGLIENDSLLILNLSNNAGAANTAEFKLVQDKLMDNRKRYLKNIEIFNREYRSQAEAILNPSKTGEEGSEEDISSKSSVCAALVSDRSSAEAGVSAVLIPADASYRATPASKSASTQRVDASAAIPIAIPIQNLSLSLPNSSAKAESDSTGNKSAVAEVVPVAASEINEVISTPIVSNVASPQPNQSPAPLVMIGASEAIVPSQTVGTCTLNVFFSAPLAWRDRANRLHPLEVLDYTSERDELVQVLREVNRDLSIVFEFATTESLRTALSFGCRALHFSGHGHPQCLNFEDGRAGLQLVNVDSLRNLLRAGGLKLDFVFVSACHSRKTGEAFVEAGVPHVVCVKVDAQIEDSAANAFTRAFYLNLFCGQTVQQSFEIAKETLKLSPYVQHSLTEGDKFILLPEATPAHHCKPIFCARPVTQWPEKPYHIVMGSHGSLYDSGPGRGVGVNSIAFPIPGCSSNFFGAGNMCLPCTSPDFEGREVDMYRVITTLLARRQVTLVGEMGVGKSSLTAAVCMYVADRGLFPDGVFYVKAQGIQNHCAFLNLVLRVLRNGPPKVIEHFTRLTANSLGNQLIPTTPAESDASFRHEVVFEQEQLIVSVFSSLRLLVVFDNVDNLLSDQNNSSADFKVFLGRLFDRCKHLKLLISSSTPLSAKHVSGFGAIENCVSLGPLSLRSSVRLFARLAPSLLTSASKSAFIQAMLPQKNAHVTANSRDLTTQTAQLLGLFGNGHPAMIVKIACESTHTSVQQLVEKGKLILESMPASLPVPPAGPEAAQHLSPLGNGINITGSVIISTPPTPATFSSKTNTNSSSPSTSSPMTPATPIPSILGGEQSGKQSIVEYAI